MANKIRIDGTTANSFQIGKNGPTFTNDVGLNGQRLTTDGIGGVFWEDNTPTFNSIIPSIAVVATGNDGSPQYGVGFNDDAYVDNLQLQSKLTQILGDVSSNQLQLIFVSHNEAAIFVDTANFSEADLSYGSGAQIITLTNVTTSWTTDSNSNDVTITFDSYSLGEVSNRNIKTISFTVPNYSYLKLTPTSLNANIANVVVNGGATGQVLTTDGAGTISFIDGFEVKTTSTTSVPVYTWSGSPDINAGQGLTLVFNNDYDASVFASDTSSSFTLYAAGDNFTIWLEEGVTQRNQTTNQVEVIWTTSTNMGTFTAPDSSYNSVMIDVGVNYLSPTTLTSDISNVSILGGTTGQVLSTDGTGNLSWSSVSGGSANLVIGTRTTPVNIAISNGEFTVVGRNGNIAVHTN